MVGMRIKAAAAAAAAPATITRKPSVPMTNTCSQLVAVKKECFIGEQK